MVSDTYKQWKIFVDTGWLPAKGKHAELYQQWQQASQFCQAKHWQNPKTVKGSTFDEILQSQQNLLCFTNRVLDAMIEKLREQPWLFCITNAQGITLHMQGATFIRQTLANLGLHLGADWTDQRIGNQAIERCLITHQAQFSSGADHLSKALHPWFFSAVPIFDPMGELLASLTLVGETEQHNEMIDALIESAAREIETLLSSEQRLTQANTLLTQRDVLLEGIEQGVITWQSSGHVQYINHCARQWLGLDESHIGLHIEALFHFPPVVEQALVNRTKLEKVEVMVDCQHKLLKITLSLKPLSSGEVMALFHPSEPQTQYHERHFIGGDYWQPEENLWLLEGHPCQHRVEKAAKVSVPVLLQGEDGVGKLSLALAIHHKSQQRLAPLMIIDCAALQPEQLAQALLGDDQHSQPSKFELAYNGTLILEHVEYLPPNLQASVLAILKTGFLTRLHSQQIIPVNVRLISTSSANLDKLVESGLFSRQLCYAMQGIEVCIPAQREAVDYTRALISHILHGANRTITSDALQTLFTYSWPGNRSELLSVMDKILLSSSTNQEIHLHDLPDKIRRQCHSEQPIQSLELMEKNAIIHALKHHQGHLQQTAKALGVGRTTLWRKIRKYDIDESAIVEPSEQKS
ncbi:MULTISPECIES: sigma 54-interacting transcriptional regulator [unclassified Vibrio]|uniref:sigma 54-interacting transcriptional regulator n=1 Tax=unclassified Vibrio TaxID=2614977 RepID=UPI0014824333|nr:MULTISPECIES: sigma 54-interacting transcriptional regulator [unclassified Vibrio]NNN44709.1 hypothetical protein [Vibrio sp. 1-1(7)]NNN72082.1 hypothetical protein [Vibrio sp. 12-2(3-a)]